jgi:uncharacterized protein (TIGR00661 family)
MSIAKRILLSPLDWGLGHTTRCIPLIRELLDRGHHITVACNNFQKQFLESYRLNVQYVHLNGYDVSYHNKGSMMMKMAGQIPKIMQKIKEENNWLKQYVIDNEVDIIISDNRFGFYHNMVESIYITHQINIRANSFVSPVLYKLHDMVINNFHHCWIPDTPNNDYAGELSLSKNPSFNYIGLLSRFSDQIMSNNKETFDYTAILSGPEPQRTIFEEIVIKTFASSNKTLLLVGGTTSIKWDELPSNISYQNLSNAEDFNKVLHATQRVIARSGYSTIMDMAFLQLPVYFVPTPGQTEQEYLAQFHGNKNAVKWVHQSAFKLPDIDQFNALAKPEDDHTSYLQQALNRVGL